MSNDGAQLGFMPEQAVKAIFGDDEARNGTRMTTMELAAKIEAVKEPDSYDNATLYTAKLIISFLLDHPRFVNTKDLYTVMKEHGVNEPLGLTGFMWGWAENAARAVMELPPVPNPAIIEG